MNSRIIRSLFVTFLISMAGSIVYLLILNALFGNSGEEPVIRFTGEMALSFLATGFICAFVLLPLSILDKQQLENSSFETLVSRYLPLIALPLGMLLCVALFAEYDHEDEYAFVITALLNIISTAYTALCVFVRMMKRERFGD